MLDSRSLYSTCSIDPPLAPAVLHQVMDGLSCCMVQVLFKEAMWQGLGAEERLQFLERGVCPGNPNTPLNLVCRNEWMHYLVSYVQPWEPVDTLLDTVYTFVQSQGSHFQTV